MSVWGSKHPPLGGIDCKVHVLGAWADLPLQDGFAVLIILKYLLVEFKQFGIITASFQIHRLQEQEI